ncbi:MAG TPA: BON domain-containing protein [Gemmataceae bacterium]|nr:BON domain-containing protein [Gemmataceae bacterium]
MSTNRHLNQGKRKKEKGTKQTKAYSSPFFLLPFAFCLLLLPGRLPAEDAGWLDLRHTLLARQTLLDDSKLAPLDLGVRVRNRVVTLWGPVPSAELARRAVACLARLPEFVEVRNELCIESEGNLVHDVPPKPRLVPQPPRSPDGPRRAVPSAGVLTKTPVIPNVVQTLPGNPASSGKSSQPAPIWTPVARPAPAAPASVVPMVAVETAIRQLQQGNERFRRIRVQVQDSKVTLSGIVYRWEDMHEFARAVGRIPGVTRVTLQNVETDATRR